MQGKFDIELLRRLCLTDGVSGFEDDVRELIANEINEYCDDLYSDALGNLIGVRYGKCRDKKIMLCAHMDEVGFCIKHVNDDGTLLFDAVGMSASVMPSKRVKIGKDSIPGVIGCAPVHLSTAKTDLKISDLYIDVGAKDRKDAEALFGQYAVFDSDFCLFGNGFVKAKALDDRIGCTIMCMLAKEKPEYDTYFVFTVGEEVGGVGAAAATVRINPDICLILEGTTASDIHGNSGADKVCCVGSGPVCPYMDGGTLYDKELYSFIMNLASKNKVPCQTKARVAGGTDAARVQKSSAGVKVAAISLPCRYIHTSASVASVDDMENMYRLTSIAVAKIAEI